MGAAVTHWRLIDTGSLDGAGNMAIDEALIECFDPVNSAPVLRLYGWDPPCLSLGRSQHPDRVLDIDRCKSSGVPFIQRVTGGGVIYHRDEITYALVCNPSHVPPATSIKDSFRSLTSFLICFYRKLGLDPIYAIESQSAGPTIGLRTDFCFAGRESYDILLKGRKIGGNAQRRQRNLIFQHGSIPLYDHSAVGAAFLKEPPRIGETGVSALADFGVTDTPEALKQLLVQAFLETLPAYVSPDSLTEQELLHAELRRSPVQLP